MNIAAAQEGKKEKVLNTLVRHKEGVMTRKNWLEMQFKNNCTVKESTKKRIMFDRKKFNRMMCYAEQNEYEKKCNENVICYKLQISEFSYFEINKTEFDYFNSLKN